MNAPPRCDVPLDALRECFEGATPAIMATCSDDGTPNIGYLSQVQYVDSGHVALSYQFFNKTRANVLANPRAQVMVPHPDTAAMYRLDLQYLRTWSLGLSLLVRPAPALRFGLWGEARHVADDGVPGDEGWGSRLGLTASVGME